MVAFENPMYEDSMSKKAAANGGGGYRAESVGEGLYDEPAFRGETHRENPIYSSQENLAEGGGGAEEGSAYLDSMPLGGGGGGASLYLDTMGSESDHIAKPSQAGYLDVQPPTGDSATEGGYLEQSIPEGGYLDMHMIEQNSGGYLDARVQQGASGTDEIELQGFGNVESAVDDGEVLGFGAPVKTTEAEVLPGFNNVEADEDANEVPRYNADDAAPEGLYGDSGAGRLEELQGFDDAPSAAAEEAEASGFWNTGK